MADNSQVKRKGTSKSNPNKGKSLAKTKRAPKGSQPKKARKSNHSALSAKKIVKVSEVTDESSDDFSSSDEECNSLISGRKRKSKNKQVSLSDKDLLRLAQLISKADSNFTNKTDNSTEQSLTTDQLQHNMATQEENENVSTHNNLSTEAVKARQRAYLLLEDLTRNKKGAQNLTDDPRSSHVVSNDADHTGQAQSSEKSEKRYTLTQHEIEVQYSMQLLTKRGN